MRVKQLVKRFMSDLKNLKVAAEIHKRLKMASLEDDIPLQVYTEAALELALKERAKLRRQAEERLKLSQNGTSKS